MAETKQRLLSKRNTLRLLSTTEKTFEIFRLTTDISERSERKNIARRIREMFCQGMKSCLQYKTVIGKLSKNKNEPKNLSFSASRSIFL